MSKHRNRQPREIIVRVIQEQAPKECEHYWVPVTNTSCAGLYRCAKCGTTRSFQLSDWTTTLTTNSVDDSNVISVYHKDSGIHIYNAAVC